MERYQVVYVCRRPHGWRKRYWAMAGPVLDECITPPGISADMLRFLTGDLAGTCSKCGAAARADIIEIRAAP